jgi:hypothetical protein
MTKGVTNGLGPGVPAPHPRLKVEVRLVLEG